VARGTRNIELIDDHKADPEAKEYKFNPQNMKIGGLSEALSTIERRVFASRSLNPKIRRLLGQTHVRGILLHGPPGTGKTLIAREICRNLGGDYEVVNGPEIYSENPGKSEEFIRNLFKKAGSEQNAKGQKSRLYCIIIDEIDAIGMKRKLNTSCEVYNLVVNQLLTCIDGVTALTNILVIGTTNRRDMLDEALLRPGRLEVHIEVGVPCETGRLEILRVHTHDMRSNGLLADNSNLPQIAALTRNYTGAEIEGVVKSAQSHAILRWRSGDPQGKCQIRHEDLLLGVMEVEPQLGKDSRTLENLIPRQKIPILKHEQTKAMLRQTIDSLREGKHAILVEGESGVGKTVMAAECGLETKFDFTRIINADRLIALTEEQANLEINSVFLDADKFSSSLIILDDLMRLINYIPLGPVFAQTTLNLIINLLRKVVDPAKKQVILATCSGSAEMAQLGLTRFFKYCFRLDKISGQDINKVLVAWGFDQSCASHLSREVQSATVRRLTDVSDIVGAADSQKWLQYWNLCA
jgi:vesicle-fusing ATPase